MVQPFGGSIPEAAMAPLGAGRPTRDTRAASLHASERSHSPLGFLCIATCGYVMRELDGCDSDRRRRCVYP